MPRKKAADWKTIKAELLRDPDTAKEYEALAPEYEFVRQVIAARHAQGITQAELARRTGIQQSNLSRLERGEYNPSLAFMKRVAAGLGRQLEIGLR